MNILALAIFILNLFLIISILIQQEEIKSLPLIGENNNFFSNNLEKATFILFITQFSFLLIQLKFKFF